MVLRPTHPIKLQVISFINMLLLDWFLKNPTKKVFLKFFLRTPNLSKFLNPQEIYQDILFITYSSRFIHNIYTLKVWRKLKVTFDNPFHPSHQMKNPLFKTKHITCKASNFKQNLRKSLNFAQIVKRVSIFQKKSLLNEISENLKILLQKMGKVNFTEVIPLFLKVWKPKF